MKALLATLLLVGCITSAAAADPQPGENKERQTLEQYGRAHPTCLEWSDGCAVCARHADGTVRCSLPGISCQSTSLACRADTPAGAPSAAPPSVPQADKPPVKP